MNNSNSEKNNIDQISKNNQDSQNACEEEQIRREKEAITQRRFVAGIHCQPPISAIALSGGGIRSATFCFGLIRALAANKSLHHFDYMSTVSGGGYTGGMLGRLYHPHQQADAVENGLASKRSLLLWWLRNNGRYLTPAGFKDTMQAMAYTLRGLLASQVQAATLMLFLAALMLLPGLFLNISGKENDPGRVWLWLMLLPLAFALYQICAYWAIVPHVDEPLQKTRPQKGRGGDYYVALLLPVVTIILIVAHHMSVTNTYSDKSLIPWVFIPLVIISFSCIPFFVQFVKNRFRTNVNIKTPATQRLIRTKILANTILIILICFLFYCATQFCYWIKIRENRLIFILSLALIPLAISLLRRIVKLPTKKLKKHTSLMHIVNLGGYLFLLLLFLSWSTLLLIVLTDVYVPQDGSGQLALLMNILFLLLMGVYFCIMHDRIDVLNLSSMHNLYRARLERAYLSVGNYADDTSSKANARFPVSPLMSYRNALKESKASEKLLITDVRPGDDVKLHDYCPHKYGGPIHLINCCINQTIDDRTGNYNADRKGIALTVGPMGIEIGTHLPDATHWKEERLSKWLAISGAAFGTGMGSRTGSGTAALLFTSAIRLGFWNDNLLKKHRQACPHTPLCKSASTDSTTLADRFPHLRALIGEMLAFFPGKNSDLWYISDGGHFDNTGVYALLKRKVPLIVLADCGADPDYCYEDIENLVRKADIDHATRIEFLDNTVVDPHFAPLFTTPALLTDRHNSAPFMLARIAYPDTESAGAMIVVKPHLIDNLPLHLTQYAEREYAFPQQSTGDQFFDESQWESYHQLGFFLGEQLNNLILANAISWVNTPPHNPQTPSLLTDAFTCNINDIRSE